MKAPAGDIDADRHPGSDVGWAPYTAVCIKRRRRCVDADCEARTGTEHSERRRRPSRGHLPDRPRGVPPAVRRRPTRLTCGSNRPLPGASDAAFWQWSGEFLLIAPNAPPRAQKEKGMAADFSVVINARQHFGNDPDSLPGTFVGKDRDFGFDCPAVDTTQTAVLMFQSLHVDHEKNVLSVNQPLTGPISVFGGIPVSRSHADWNGNIMLIDPKFLRDRGNVLHIGARDSRGSRLGDVDDFVIDNAVVMYKTR